MARIASYRGSARAPRRLPLLAALGVLLVLLFVFAVFLYTRVFSRPTPPSTAGSLDDKAAVWCEQGVCYWMNRSGFATDSAPDTDGVLVTVFTSAQSRSLTRFARIVSPEEAARLFEIIEMLARAKLSVREARVDTERSRELVVSLASGQHLLFSTHFSSLFAEPIIQALTTQGSFSRLRYLDFRSENRAYYQ